MQTLADGHDTPLSSFSPAPFSFGVGWIAQFVPFQCSARVTLAPGLVKKSPTAVQALADEHEIPERLLSGSTALLGLGIDWIAQSALAAVVVVGAVVVVVVVVARLVVDEEAPDPVVEDEHAANARADAPTYAANLEAERTPGRVSDRWGGRIPADLFIGVHSRSSLGTFAVWSDEPSGRTHPLALIHANV